MFTLVLRSQAMELNKAIIFQDNFEPLNHNDLYEL